MLNRIFIFATFLPALAATAWFSSQLDTSIQSEGEVRRQNWRVDQANRRELLEFLDRLVSQERYFRSVNGYYATDLKTLGFVAPESIRESYEILIQKTSEDRLKVVASAKEGVDQISISQDFEVQANFSMPQPSVEHLKSCAAQHLQKLRESPQGQIPTESGVYRGYFRYEASPDRHLIFATGLRPPVLGLRVEVPVSQGDREPTSQRPSYWPGPGPGSGLIPLIRKSEAGQQNNAEQKTDMKERRTPASIRPKASLSSEGESRVPNLEIGAGFASERGAELEIEPIAPDE